MAHIPVLLNEVIEGLALRAGDTAIDGTVGYGGHAAAICEAIGPAGTLLALDADGEALRAAEDYLRQFPGQKIFAPGNFRAIETIAQREGVTTAAGILFDLGLNSAQLDQPGRGFSFRRDEPLLMTLADVPVANSLTAADIVNTLSEEELAGIIYAYGEEQFSRRIAKAIVEARMSAPIKTTGELVSLIEASVPAFYRKRKIHPATKTFQALRIAVNDELDALTEGLAGAWNLLQPGGRLAVISFHSLEARLVKNFYNERKKEKTGRVITKHAQKPGVAENKANRRSRSAELRIIEKN